MLKKLFSRQLGGLIHYYDLSDWYLKLSHEQQSKIKHYYSMGSNADEKNIDTGNVSSSASGQNFLANIGLNAVHHKDYDFAEIILTKALINKDDNAIDRHFVYNALIDMYYSLRDIRPNAVTLCIQYCLQDIERIDEFIDAWLKRFESGGELNNLMGLSVLQQDHNKTDLVPEPVLRLPRIPSFERLAIIYEKQGDYQSAIQLCQKAIVLGLHDSTKGGFLARKARLEKKQKQ